MVELTNRVRVNEFEGDERTVDSHVKNLRRKVGTIRAIPGSSRPSWAAVTGSAGPRY